MKMPIAGISNAIFEGNIEMDSTATTSAIQCRPQGATSGSGTFQLQINNKSTAAYAISQWFQGFVFVISYQGTTIGLFSQPLNVGTGQNEYTLTLKQGASCDTVLASGNYNITLEGGNLTIYNGCNVNIKGKMKGCGLTAKPASTTTIQAEANTVAILNDQVKVLTLLGTWTSCSYRRTSSSLCILAGQFYDFQFNTSVGILKITGYVKLVNTTTAIVNANEYLEVSGKLVGNALQVIQLNQRSPVVISGYVKQLGEFAPAIKSAGGAYTHSLTLKNAVIEAGASSPESIKVDIPDGIELKLYGKSYSNKPLVGTGAVNYLVGSADDFVVDADVSVIDL